MEMNNTSSIDKQPKGLLFVTLDNGFDKKKIIYGFFFLDK